MAGTLSGGEQQMLAIGRALMVPKILLLDEPSLGLAPILVKSIFDTVKEINKSGVTVILVEQNAKAALKLAHRGYVMEVGNIVLADTVANLLKTNRSSRLILAAGTVSFFQASSKQRIHVGQPTWISFSEPFRIQCGRSGD